MNDEDLLRTGLGTLTAVQPPPPDRVGAVQRLVRRRARRRAAVAGSLALAGVVGAAVVLQPGPAVERTLPPAGPGLQWEPRGELLDEADTAVRAWAPDGAADVRVLFAGALAAVDALSARALPTSERWYVVQGDPGGGTRLAVLRDRDGSGPADPVVVGERSAPAPGARQLSVLATEVPAGSEGFVWPGTPGVELTSTLFVLPRPQARTVLRRVRQSDGQEMVTSLPVGPSLSTFRTPTASVRLSVDREVPVRAGMPGAVEPRLTVAPPDVPEGWVVASSGVGAATRSGGQPYDVPVRVLVRCTTWGGPLRVVYTQTASEQQTDAACDGTTEEPFGGPIDPVPVGGYAPQDRGDYLGLSGDDVDQAQWVLLVRQADADRLGIRPPG